jgi:flagellar motor component MotA
LTAPTAFISLLIATACGLLFHLLRGGGLSRLGLYVATSWISFFLGHFVAEWLDWRLWRWGALNLFAALLATLLGLIASSILAGPERGTRAGKGGRPHAGGKR